MFAPQVAAMQNARAIDGYSGRDTLEAMAAHVLDDAPDRFDLVGHSMGGRVALEIVRQAPRRVRRLALVSTGTHGVEPGEADKRHRLSRIGREQGFDRLVDAWLTPMIGEPSRGNPSVTQPLFEMCRAQGQAVWDAHVAALLARREATTLLPTIACPTLVMTGALDRWSPPAQHEAIAAAIPGAALEIVPQAGHMITHEAPAAVNTALMRWLSISTDPSGENP